MKTRGSAARSRDNAPLSEGANINVSTDNETQISSGSKREESNSETDDDANNFVGAGYSDEDFGRGQSDTQTDGMGSGSQLDVDSPDTALAHQASPLTLGGLYSGMAAAQEPGLINLDLRPTAMNSHMKHTNWNSERTNFTNKKTTKRRSLPKPYTTPIRPSTRAANARSSALARGMGQDRPDQEMIGIFAEKPDEDRNLSTSIYAILWDNAIEHLEGVTWEASSWVEATPRRQAHLDMWNFRIYSGETVQVDDSVTRVWNLKVAIGFSIPALMEEQKRAERQVSRRQQLFKDIISLANEELRNDIFGMIDPHRFSYAAPLLDAHQTTASTMLQTLRIKMLTDGGHSKECKTTKFGFQPGCAQDPKPTVTRSAFDLLAPLLPASLPHSKYEYDLSTFIDDANFRNLEYKAAIFSPSKEKLLSRAGYYNASEDVKAFVKREHESPNRQAARKRALELSALVEQMIVDAPFLIGNRYFTVLAELVCGTATLRSLVNEIGINYPSNAFHVNRGYWLQAYHWSGRYGAYSQRQSERDFQMLRISFGVLKEADSESQCSS